MINFGYGGLADPLDTQWADGRNVTIYPDGKVVEKDTDAIVQKSKSQLPLTAILIGALIGGVILWKMA